MHRTCCGAPGREVIEMLGTTWTRLKHEEDGMSVLEIVLAAFILFFVFTAMLGLVGATTKMGVDAKSRVAMTNAVSSHMEWVRSLPFDEVGIRGVTPGGVVEPTYTYAVDGFTVTIQNQIADGQDGTKELRVTASAEAANFKGVSMTSFAAIRDVNTLSLVSLDDENADAPVVEFTSTTAEADDDLYRGFVLGGNPLYIEARAEAVVDGGHITDLRYYCQGELLRAGDSIFDDVAEWTLSATPVSELFGWDTTQVDEDTVPVISDGWRLVYVIATDNEGNEGRAERRFYVDNYAPEVPGSIVAEVQDSIETRLSWGVAQDGTDAAAKYEVETARLDYAGSLVDVSKAPVTDPAYIHHGTPFSRYVAGVRAGSLRNLWSDPVALVSPFSTRPEAHVYSTAVYVDRGKKLLTDVSISVDEPTFKTLSVVYDIYRSDDPNNMGSSPHQSNLGSPYFIEQAEQRINAGKPALPYYYQFKVTFTADGPGGGAVEEIWSDVIGPTTIVNTATEPMGHMSW